MSSLANSREVRRHELQSPSTSPRSSPDLSFISILRSKYEHDLVDNASHVTSSVQNPLDGAEDEAELILFQSLSSAPPTHKIRLSSPDAGSQEPGFLVKKPKSYYFATSISKEKGDEYGKTAVTAADVMHMSKIPWLGCATLSKLQIITPSGMRKAVRVGHPPTLHTLGEAPRKRTRKGKKTRIALRKKLQATREREAERSRQAQEVEAYDRDKRARKNREKKLKKRARKRVAKATGDSGDLDDGSPEPALSSEGVT